MAEPVVLDFSDPRAEQDLVGGKGVNLALMTVAGFPVPSGFCVTTSAYREALSGEIGELIGRLADTIDYTDADGLERKTAEIREAISSVRIPDETRTAITNAYSKLGEQPYVAVRSSGTAEDLEGTSFAGLHDTYLDIRGVDDVVDAVRRCWASLWTARATAYRRKNGFDHRKVALSAVVQTMVTPQASGVMFTANPMTGSTDEIVINSSYGLGEAIVSGIVTPDEIAVAAGTMRVIEATTGEKALRIDRSPNGVGTSTSDVATADRGRLSVTGAQIVALAQLGRRVEAHYGGIPQDIEWAVVDETVHLLQSRPITGVELNWDTDVDAWQASAEDPDVVWTRAMAEEVWTGAITPLFYSWRAYLWQTSHADLCRLAGLPDAENMWFWKFHKSEAYYNTALQRQLVERATPPPFRALMLGTLPPEERSDAQDAPFDYLAHLRRYLKTQIAEPQRGFLTWQRKFDELVETTLADGRRFLHTDLSLLSDRDLIRHIDATIEREGAYYREIWIPFWIFSRDMSGVLGGMIESWYDGDNQFALVELMTGVPKQTVTMEENHRLWLLSERIRGSQTLRTAFEAADGQQFLSALAELGDEGRDYLAEYQRFLDDFGHRGHADRDTYFSRRCEDPNIDHRSINAMLGVTESVDPLTKERELNARREAVVDDVVSRIRRLLFGNVRAQAFTFVLDYVLKFLMARDNERTMADMTTLAVKHGCQEIAERLLERRILDTAQDHHFLAKHELYALLEGRTANMALTAAKIATRRTNFKKYLDRTANLPRYLHRNKGLDLDAPVAASDDGVLRGTGTSRGSVTAIARVVHSLDEIGRVRNGEILICHATDPGWTPVFLVIAGLVLETGGVLAHGSCISREYGLPCVQVAGATGLIPDGATVTINGDTGTVVIESVSHETDSAEGSTALEGAHA